MGYRERCQRRDRWIDLAVTALNNDEYCDAAAVLDGIPDDQVRDVLFQACTYIQVQRTALGNVTRELYARRRPSQN